MSKELNHQLLGTCGALGWIMIVRHIIVFLPNFQVHFQLLSQQHSDLCLGDVNPLNRTNGSIAYVQGKLAFVFVDVFVLGT